VLEGLDVEQQEGVVRRVKIQRAALLDDNAAVREGDLDLFGPAPLSMAVRAVQADAGLQVCMVVCRGVMC
jgi:hypothetical protein